MTKNLQHPDIFQDRHIGPNHEEQQLMLSVIGASTLDELINQTVPPAIHLDESLALGDARSEFELLHELRSIASQNTVAKSYIGMGYYGTITPPVILRNLMENPGWYTQYTPYQAEIAQGRLESLLNFQTMVMDLTAMEIANASLLDEATAAAEAMHLMHAINTKGNTLFASQDIFPQTIEVLKTRCEPLGVNLVVGDHNDLVNNWNSDVFGVVIQYPDGNGSVSSYAEFTKLCHDNNALVAVATDLMALLLITPPGEWGADVVFGSAQRFGVPMGYGGPHAAFFATKDEYKRQLPGRIIGVSVDSHGNRALRMALQTREQHIRRDKATSNICTAQALLANMSAMYAVYHGPKVLKSIAERLHHLTVILA
jgi:glycine dehydrogenase